MSRPLPPAAERRALALVDDLVDSDDPATIDTALAQEDPAIRARVQRLLGHARTAGDALPTLIDGGLFDALPLPTRVGPFALVEEIGVGGMGSVWRGARADGLYDQSVAIKFLRTSATLLGARFDAERRILARLEHPNIARLIDGGVTEAGVPFLVMEYVPGRHIDEAAAALALADRIALFVDAARAVQFAHARLVVHADLKPSNIIVGDDGRAKLLDFGVARLIGDEDQPASHPMTPAFASPARHAGQPPLIADDVFALGRILAALIDPADADLAAIAAKAQADDEAQRYASVGDLIADLARWQDRLPVTARAPTWRYRTARFVARHRIGIAATVTAMLLLIALATTALLAARAAERSRLAAETRFNEVRSLSRFLLTDLYDELANAPGTVLARVRIAQVAGAYLDRLSRTPEAPRALRLEVAQGYERLARVQGVSGVASLGRPSEALRSLDQAAAITATLLAQTPQDAAANELAGWIAMDRWTLAAENAQSPALSETARAHFQRALARDPARQGALIGLLLTEKNRAFDLLWTEDRPAAAVPVLRAALARLDAARIRPEYREQAQDLRVNLLNRLGDAVYYAGDIPGSLVPFRAAQRLIEAELARRETLAWLERRGESYWYVSGTLEETDVPAALAAAQAGARTMERVLSYGPDANAEKWLAILFNQEASLRAATGDTAGAVAPALRSIAIRQRRAASQPNDPRRARDLAIGLGSAAETLAKAGRRAEACTLGQRALATWRDLERRHRLGKRDAGKTVPAARAVTATLCAS